MGLRPIFCFFGPLFHFNIIVTANIWIPGKILIYLLFWIFKIRWLVQKLHMFRNVTGLWPSSLTSSLPLTSPLTSTYDRKDPLSSMLVLHVIVQQFLLSCFKIAKWTLENLKIFTWFNQPWSPLASSCLFFMWCWKNSFCLVLKLQSLHLKTCRILHDLASPACLKTLQTQMNIKLKSLVKYE